MATATEAIPRKDLAAVVEEEPADEEPAGELPEVVTVVAPAAQALEFPRESPAITHGVVSELIWMLLPGGWAMEIVALVGDAVDEADAGEEPDPVDGVDDEEEGAAGVSPEKPAATSDDDK
jgi:hypothetical protein